jgi:hypothetical protein
MGSSDTICALSDTIAVEVLFMRVGSKLKEDSLRSDGKSFGSFAKSPDSLLRNAGKLWNAHVWYNRGSCFKVHVDIPGQNAEEPMLKEVSMKEIESVLSPMRCQALCAREPACEYITYSNVEHRCLLKVAISLTPFLAATRSNSNHNFQDVHNFQETATHNKISAVEDGALALGMIAAPKRCPVLPNGEQPANAKLSPWFTDECDGGCYLDAYYNELHPIVGHPEPNNTAAKHSQLMRLINFYESSGRFLGAHGEGHDCKCYDRCLSRFKLDEPGALPPRWPPADTAATGPAARLGGVTGEDASTDEPQQQQRPQLKQQQRPQLNVLVAVRDRKGQLGQWLLHTQRSMEYNGIDAKYFVVEQTEAAAWNKGQLMNIGYMHAVGKHSKHSMPRLIDDVEGMYKDSGGAAGGGGARAAGDSSSAVGTGGGDFGRGGSMNETAKEVEAGEVAAGVAAMQAAMGEGDGGDAAAQGPLEMWLFSDVGTWETEAGRLGFRRCVGGGSGDSGGGGASSGEDDDGMGDAGAAQGDDRAHIGHDRAHTGHEHGTVSTAQNRQTRVVTAHHLYGMASRRIINRQPGKKKHGEKSGPSAEILGDPLGGIFCMPTRLYEAVNGFSNRFYRAGLEDVDMARRITHHGVIDRSYFIPRVAQSAPKTDGLAGAAALKGGDLKGGVAGEDGGRDGGDEGDEGEGGGGEEAGRHKRPRVALRGDCLHELGMADVPSLAEMTKEDWQAHKHMTKMNAEKAANNDASYKQDFDAAIAADGVRSMHFGADYAIMHTEERHANELDEVNGVDGGVAYTHILVELADMEQTEHLVWD